MSNHYFIGIPISSSTKQSLVEWQHTLREHMNYKVWTHPEDFHITLKFLGDSTDDKVRELVTRLKSGSWPSAFKLQVGPAGSFGDNQQPRVWHAEVTPVDALIEMKEATETIAATLGWKREGRPFHPHVTIAKKQAEGTSPKESVTLFSQHFDEYIDRFHLYRIHPRNEQKYEEVATIHLGQEGKNGPIN